MWGRLCGGLCMLCFMYPLWAAPYQSLPMIEKKARSFILEQLTEATKQGQIEVQIRPLDYRLKLSPCEPSKLVFYSPYNRTLEQSRTVGVKCLGPVRWSFYIPFSMKRYMEVVVASHYLEPNQAITRNDIKTMRINVSHADQGYFTRLDDVVGKLAVRQLLKDKVISPDDLKLINIVKKGDIVTVTAMNKAIKVSVKGTAQQAGRMGDRILVKNLTSDKMIEGIIIGEKHVSVKF